MLLSDIYRELRSINARLKTLIMLNDEKIKRITVNHNQKQGLLAWVGQKDMEKFMQLRKKNPELFDYISGIIELYLCDYDKADNGNQKKRTR